MPKEYTHWSIAEKVKGKLSGRAKENLDKFSDFYYLGAVFHDTLYYYTGSEQRVLLQADALHGSMGEDTYEPVRQLIKSSRDKGGHVEAFCAGMLTHIAVDNYFHPFIYYYTGDYYSKDKEQKLLAQFRHRQLESGLDCYFGAMENRYDFGRMVESLKNNIDNFFPRYVNLSGFFELKREQIIESFNNYRLARSVYSSKWKSKSLQLFKPILPSSLKTVAELSYFNIEWEPPIEYSKDFSYLHPVTGEKLVANIKELTSRAVYQSQERVMELFNSGTISVKGCSLENGLEGVPVDKMRFYDESL